VLNFTFNLTFYLSPASSRGTKVKLKTRHRWQGCGHVSSIDNPQWQIVRWRSPGIVSGSYVIHLGSSLCDDTQADDYPSAIAEHELAHALGLNDHFEGFHGGGLRSPNLLNVLYNLYLNPPGATADQLVVRRISVGELGDY